MKSNIPNNQTKSSTIFRNFSFLTTSKIFADISTFLLFVVISRVFGQEGIGQYSFAMAFTGFFVVFADFGLNSLSIKEMSRLHEAEILCEYLGKIISLRFFLAIAVLALLFVSQFFLSFSHETIAVIAIIGTYQIVYSLIDGFIAIFIAQEDMHYASAVELSLKMTTALAGISLIWAGGKFLMVIGVLPIISFIHLILVFCLVSKKYGKPKFKFSLSQFGHTLRNTTPYGFSVLLNQFNTRLDVVALGFFLGASAAGIYNVGYKVVFLLLIIPRFIGITLFPIASKLYLDSHSKLRKLYNKSLSLACLVGLPSAAGLWLIAPDLIDSFFGQDFVESANLLRYLAWLLFVIFFRAIMGVFLTSCDMQLYRAKGQFVAAGFNVLGNVILIPLLGIKGAAIATLFSEIILTFLFAFRLKGLLGWPRIWSKLIMGIVATSIFSMVIFFFAKSLPLFVEIPIAVVLYGGTLMLFKEFREEEFLVITELYKNTLAKQ